MQDDGSVLSSRAYEMLIASVTREGTLPLQAIEAERLLNAIARAESGVPTAANVVRRERGT